MRAGVASLDPFAFAGDPRGVLLLHGFTGSPFEMRPLGEALARGGFTVEAPALSGHGPDAARLHVTRWEDFARSAERAFDALAARCPMVAVCGLSMGGLLALHLALARRERVAALVLLSTALWLPSWHRAGLARVARSPLLRRLRLPKLGGSDIADPEMRRRNPRRDIPIEAVLQLCAGMDLIGPRVAEVTAPALLAHGGCDRTIEPACTAALAERLGGPTEQMALPCSRHVVTLDVEREALFARIERFLQARLVPGR